jgi:hypothetical protein
VVQGGEDGGGSNATDRRRFTGTILLACSFPETGTGCKCEKLLDFVAKVENFAPVFIQIHSLTFGSGGLCGSGSGTWYAISFVTLTLEIARVLGGFMIFFS